MIFTWLIASLIGVALLGAFFDEIMDWAKDIFDSLSSSVRNAWVYIRRVPGGIKQMIRFIENGSMKQVEEKKEVEWDEVVRMHDNGDIDDETFNALKADRDKRIAEMNRDR